MAVSIGSGRAKNLAVVRRLSKAAAPRMLQLFLTFGLTIIL
jgi:hypothetical protein